MHTRVLIAASLLALAAVVQAESSATDSQHADTWDLRTTFDNLPSYEIKEDAKATVSGATSTYTWNDTGTRVWQVGFEALKAVPRNDNSCYVYGFRTNVAAQRAEPESFTVGGSKFSNVNNEALSWIRLGLGVEAGWQTTPLVIDQTRLFTEVTAFAEAVQVQAVTTGSVTARGLGWEAGVRVAAMLGERSWYGGIAATFLIGKVQITDVSSFNGTATSTLNLQRQGAGVGIIAGYRF